MYARVARFEGGDVSRLDEVIEATREQIESGIDSPPAGLEGATGAWMFVDRTSGSGLGITFFESEEALRRGDEALNKLSPAVPDASGRRTGVEIYEVAVRKER